MSRRLTSLIMLGVAIVAGSCKSASSGNTELASGPKPRGLCKGLDVDADAREFHQDLIRIVTASDSSSIRTRATVPLPVMPVDSVILVNDPVICEKASVAISRVRGLPAPGYDKISVFRLGSVYVANRPDGHAGIEAIVFDANLKLRFGWML